MRALGDAEQRASDLLADRAHVGRAGPQVRVGAAPAQLGLDRGHGVDPGRGAAAAAVDPGADVVEQVGVVEQQQVRVEDRGVALADLAAACGPDPLDLAAHLARSRPRSRRHSASALVAGRLVRDVHVGRRRTSAGPIAIPGEAGSGVPFGRARGWPAARQTPAAGSGSSKPRAASATTWSTPRAPGCRWPSPRPGARAAHRAWPPGTGCVAGTQAGSGVEVAQLDRASNSARLLDQRARPAGRAGRAGW